VTLEEFVKMMTPRMVRGRESERSGRHSDTES
jgi:hypothetical protein